MGWAETTGWGVHENDGRVGRRIGQARRELGLTQAVLAEQIGISLGALDRLETGKGDPSDKLADIAELTGKPISWYTSDDEYDGGIPRESGLPAELRRRLSESNRRDTTVTDPELDGAEVANLADPHVLREDEDLESGVQSSTHTAVTSEEQEERLRAHQHELEAALVAERQQHAARAAQMAEQLERVNANQLELAGIVEAARAELAASHAEETRLSERALRLEGELQASEGRTADAMAGLDRSEAELAYRSAELDLREAAVAAAKTNLGFRSAQLDTRESELRFRSTQLDTRDAELRYRSAQLDTREAAVDAEETRVAAPAHRDGLPDGPTHSTD